MADLAREMNLKSAQLARAACDKYSTPGHPRYVAGALGPTPKTASHQPRRERSGRAQREFRAAAPGLPGADAGADRGRRRRHPGRDHLRHAQRQGRAVRGGRGLRAKRECLPIMISGTVTDASGRILSGQTVTAFWHSVRHANPLSIGLNCALGRGADAPYVQELNKAAPETFISCYPNAGLPNPMSDTGFDETPEVTSRLVHEFASEAWSTSWAAAAAPRRTTSAPSPRPWAARPRAACSTRNRPDGPGGASDMSSPLPPVPSPAAGLPLPVAAPVPGPAAGAPVAATGSVRCGGAGFPPLDRVFRSTRVIRVTLHSRHAASGHGRALVARDAAKPAPAGLRAIGGPAGAPGPVQPRRARAAVAGQRRFRGAGPAAGGLAGPGRYSAGPGPAAAGSPAGFGGLAAGAGRRHDSWCSGRYSGRYSGGRRASAVVPESADGDIGLCPGRRCAAGDIFPRLHCRPQPPCSPLLPQ